jgi:type I site-specific restriction-modification system R (restriction) subunit
MIIIKTKTGETLVNEKEIVSVVHDRDEHTARINEKQVGFGLRRPPIDNVESVIYINDQTGKDWKEDGSEVAHLHKLVVQAERENWHLKGLADRRADAMREFDHKLFLISEELKTDNIDEVKKIVQNYVDRRPGIMENLENYEKGVEEAKAETARVAQEQIEQDNNLTKKHRQEIATLEADVMTYCVQCHEKDEYIDELLHRSLWQRIVNKHR